MFNTMKALQSPLIALFLLLSTAVSHGESSPAISLDEKVVNIGGLSQLLFERKSNDITIATEMFFKEIAKHIGVESTVLTIYKNTAEMRMAIQDGSLDTVFVNPIDYLDLDSQINPNFRYTLTFGQVPEQRILLLTHQKQQPANLSELKDKRLSIPRGYILGKLYLEIVLAQAGLPPMEEFFSSINYTNNTNESALDIFFNKADLSVTSDLAYTLACELNPQILKKTDILSSSTPYIPFVIGVSKHVPEKTLMDLDSILKQVNNEPRIRQLLSLFSAKDLVKITPQQLQDLRELKENHQQLFGKQ